jgi:hypothetical protein
MGGRGGETESVRVGGLVVVMVVVMVVVVRPGFGELRVSRVIMLEACTAVLN